jgi:hypothetical protein
MYCPIQKLSPPIKALMVPALLWSKGIGELVEAAKILVAQGVPLQIQVAGDIDPQTPASISFKLWRLGKKKTSNVLGPAEDIAALYATTICCIAELPRGTPKSCWRPLLCKPIVTTDVPWMP